MRLFKSSRKNNGERVIQEAVERAKNVKGDMPGTPGLIFNPKKK